MVMRLTSSRTSNIATISLSLLLVPFSHCSSLIINCNLSHISSQFSKRRVIKPGSELNCEYANILQPLALLKFLSYFNFVILSERNVFVIHSRYFIGYFSLQILHLPSFYTVVPKEILLKFSFFHASLQFSLNSL